MGIAWRSSMLLSLGIPITTKQVVEATRNCSEMLVTARRRGKLLGVARVVVATCSLSHSARPDVRPIYFVLSTRQPGLAHSPPIWRWQGSDINVRDMRGDRGHLGLDVPLSKPNSPHFSLHPSLSLTPLAVT